MVLGNQRSERGNCILRPLGHYFETGQQLTFMLIVRVERQSTLEYIRCFSRPAKANQTGGVSVQCRQLLIEQRLGFFEMNRRRRAVALLIFEDSEHGMAGQLRWTQMQKMLEERNRGPIARIVLNLNCAMKRNDVVRR